MTAVLSMSAALTAEAAGRTVAAGRPPDAWPTAPADVGDEFRAFAASALDLVRGEPGYAVLRLGTAGMDDHALTTAAWNLVTTLGRPVPQYRTGELVYPVEVGASAATVSHYSGTSRAGGFHTDGTLLPQPPDFAVLLGLSSADIGGETVLVDGAALCEALRADDPRHLAELRRAHHFDLQGQQPGVTTRKQAILSDQDGRFELRYLRRYIELGHTTAGAQLPDRLVAAMDLLDELCATPAFQHPVLLERGDLLVWNNARFLHGRLPFTEIDSKRRLRRVYAVFAPGRPGVRSATGGAHAHR